MIGKRIADNVEPDRPGEYSRHVISFMNETITCWKVVAPNGAEGFILPREVVVHSDGSISSKTNARIWIQNGTPLRWIGKIVKGKWVEQ